MGLIKDKIEELEKELHKKKVSRVEQWLDRHGVRHTGDNVFDGEGLVVKISTSRSFGYFVEVTPKREDHNLGVGFGASVRIELDYE